jgi:hypothetical protein
VKLRGKGASMKKLLSLELFPNRAADHLFPFKVEPGSLASPAIS